MSIPCENPLKLLQLPTPYKFHLICVLQYIVTSSHGQEAFLLFSYTYIYIKYITFVILLRQPSTFRHVALHIFDIHLISCYMLACRHVGIAISIIHNKLCALKGMSASSYKHINGQPLYMHVIMWTRQHVSMSA